jgi:hypothetical protein
VYVCVCVCVCMCVCVCVKGEDYQEYSSQVSQNPISASHQKHLFPVSFLEQFLLNMYCQTTAYTICSRKSPGQRKPSSMSLTCYWDAAESQSSITWCRCWGTRVGRSLVSGARTQVQILTLPLLPTIIYTLLLKWALMNQTQYERDQAVWLYSPSYSPTPFPNPLL